MGALILRKVGAGRKGGSEDGKHGQSKMEIGEVERSSTVVLSGQREEKRRGSLLSGRGSQHQDGEADWLRPAWSRGRGGNM